MFVNLLDIFILHLYQTMWQHFTNLILLTGQSTFLRLTSSLERRQLSAVITMKKKRSCAQHEIEKCHLWKKTTLTSTMSCAYPKNQT